MRVDEAVYRSLPTLAKNFPLWRDRDEEIDERLREVKRDPGTHHASRITYHVSRITQYASRITHHILKEYTK